MNNKDFNLLKEAYGEISGDSDLFHAREIEVDITSPVFVGDDTELDTYNLKTTVDYRIEIDYRSWGIKDIGVSIVKIHPFSFTVKKYKNDEVYDEQTVEVDPMNSDDITVSNTGEGVVNNGMVHPDKVEVELDSNMKPIKVEVWF